MKTRTIRPKHSDRINISSSVTPISTASNRKKAGKSRSESSRPAAEFDAEALIRLKEKIDQLPAIDAARIVEIHGLITSGEYRIDSKSLAKKIRKFEADF